MRIQQSEYGDAWYIINRDEQISKIFYNKKKATTYLKEKTIGKKNEGKKEK